MSMETTSIQEQHLKAGRLLFVIFYWFLHVLPFYFFYKKKYAKTLKNVILISERNAKPKHTKFVYLPPSFLNNAYVSSPFFLSFFPFFQSFFHLSLCHQTGNEIFLTNLASGNDDISKDCCIQNLGFVTKALQTYLTFLWEQNMQVIIVIVSLVSRLIFSYGNSVTNIDRVTYFHQ